MTGSTKSLICSACGADMVCLEHGLSLPCDMCTAEGAASSLMCARCGGAEAREVSEAERKDILEQETNPQTAKFKSLFKLAEAGDMSAAFAVAMMYWNGDGVEQDEATAINWVRKSAQKGYADAQFWIGNAHLAGDGVKKSAPEGVKWLRKAANHNHIDAQFNLARLLIYGQGAVDPDLEESKHWMERAASLGHKAAIKALRGYAGNSGFDPLYAEAVACVLRSRRAAISLVQRDLRIGYSRAGRLIDAMEKAGLVSPMNGYGNREVLVDIDGNPIETEVKPDPIHDAKPQPIFPDDEKPTEMNSAAIFASIIFGVVLISGIFIGTKFWVTAFFISLISYFLGGSKLGKGAEKLLVAAMLGIIFAGVIFFGRWIYGSLSPSEIATDPVAIIAPQSGGESNSAMGDSSIYESFSKLVEANNFEEANQKYSRIISEMLSSNALSKETFSRLLVDSLKLSSLASSQEKIHDGQNILTEAYVRLLDQKVVSMYSTESSVSSEIAILSAVAGMYFEDAKYSDAIEAASRIQSIKQFAVSKPTAGSINSAHLTMAISKLMIGKYAESSAEFDLVRQEFLPERNKVSLVFLSLLSNSLSGKVSNPEVESQKYLSLYEESLLSAEFEVLKKRTEGLPVRNDLLLMAERLVVASHEKPNSGSVFGGLFSNDKTTSDGSENGGEGWIGIEYLVEMPDNNEGVHVAGVVAGSGAEKAGIKTGDVILGIGGTKIQNKRDSIRAIQNLRANQYALITLSRNGKRMIIPVMVAGKP